MVGEAGIAADIEGKKLMNIDWLHYAEHGMAPICR